MAKISADRIVTSIDIGTTKICVLVAQQRDDDQVEILGIGKCPSDGLSKGVVVDIAKTIRSIKNAVKEAELMAGIPIEYGSIGISGAHIQSINSHGVVPIKRGQVRASDINNALAAARAIPVPEGQQILHVLPKYYLIDGREKVQEPLGMHGIRLEVQAHIILGAIASVQNLIRCCEKAGVTVTDIVLEQLASADAVLSSDEQLLGAALLDIGGGTSDLAVYKNGTICHTMVLPVAGNHFTNDLAIGLRTTLRDAERIKKEHGVVNLAVLKNDACVEVDLIHENQKQIIQQSDLARILQPRARELLDIVHQELVDHGLMDTIVAGLVLTGGGALLLGMKELAEDIFKVPVRIGSPKVGQQLPISLQNPMYATGYGLLIHVLKKRRSALGSNGMLMHRVLECMKSWIGDFF